MEHSSRYLLQWHRVLSDSSSQTSQVPTLRSYSKQVVNFQLFMLQFQTNNRYASKTACRHDSQTSFRNPKTSEAKSQTYDSEAIWQEPTRIHRKNYQSKEHFWNYFLKLSQQKTHTETKMEKKSGSSKKTHRQSFLKVLTTEETLILHKGLSFIPTTSTPNRSQLLQYYKQYICPPPRKFLNWSAPRGDL